MPTNASLDLFVAGVLLEDVGGLSNTGLDNFVAGVLYATIESPGIVVVPLTLSGTQAQVGNIVAGALHIAAALSGTQAQVGTVTVFPIHQRVTGSLGLLHVGV